jgi:hypothetical protein
MSRCYVTLSGNDADDLQVARLAGGVILVTLDKRCQLEFDNARDFACWFDQLLELALLVPEICTAWDTYPVIAP